MPLGPSMATGQRQLLSTLPPGQYQARFQLAWILPDLTAQDEASIRPQQRRGEDPRGTGGPQAGASAWPWA